MCQFKGGKGPGLRHDSLCQVEGGDLCHDSLCQVGQGDNKKLSQAQVGDHRYWMSPFYDVFEEAKRKVRTRLEGESQLFDGLQTGLLSAYSRDLQTSEKHLETVANLFCKAPDFQPSAINHISYSPIVHEVNKVFERDEVLESFFFAL